MKGLVGILSDWGAGGPSVPGSARERWLLAHALLKWGLQWTLGRSGGGRYVRLLYLDYVCVLISCHVLVCARSVDASSCGECTWTI